MVDKPSDIRAPYGDVYTNRAFIVTDNGSDEIIVRSKHGNASVRITPFDHEITVVTQSGEFRLYHINGLNGVITKSS